MSLLGALKPVPPINMPAVSPRAHPGTQFDSRKPNRFSIREAVKAWRFPKLLRRYSVRFLRLSSTLKGNQFNSTDYLEPKERHASARPQTWWTSGSSFFASAGRLAFDCFILVPRFARITFLNLPLPDRALAGNAHYTGS